MTIDEPQGGGLTEVPLHPKQGNEALRLGGLRFDNGNATVLEFWRWALGDLRANLIIGILAEWIVARLLNLPIETRPTFSEYDLATACGKRIEVKASSYLQGCKQQRLSKPSFRITRTLGWDDVTGFDLEPDFHADWYV